MVSMFGNCTKNGNDEILTEPYHKDFEDAYSVAIKLVEIFSKILCIIIFRFSRNT